MCSSSCSSNRFLAAKRGRAAHKGCDFDERRSRFRWRRSTAREGGGLNPFLGRCQNDRMSPIHVARAHVRTDRFTFRYITHKRKEPTVKPTTTTKNRTHTLTHCRKCQLRLFGFRCLHFVGSKNVYLARPAEADSDSISFAVIAAHQIRSFRPDQVGPKRDCGGYCEARVFV